MRLLVLCDVLSPLVPSLVRDESEDVDADNVEEETLLLVQPLHGAESICRRRVGSVLDCSLLPPAWSFVGRSFHSALMP